MASGDGRRSSTGDARARWGTRPSGPPPCRFCLDTGHRQEACPIVADASMRTQLLQAREANYQKLRLRAGLRPGSPFSRPQGPNWQGQSPRTSTVNLVDDGTAEEYPPAAGEGEDLYLTGESGEDA